MPSNDSDHWIEHAIKHHGALKAKAEKAGKDVEEYAQQHVHDGGVTGHQANLALTLRNFHHDGATLESSKPSDKHPSEYSTEEMPKAD
jgi:hypothetical protein